MDWKSVIVQLQCSLHCIAQLQWYFRENDHGVINMQIALLFLMINIYDVKAAIHKEGVVLKCLSMANFVYFAGKYYADTEIAYKCL